MSLRHDIVDKAREDITNYLIENNISNHEWEFIERYVNETFNKEKHKIVLSKKEHTECKSECSNKEYNRIGLVFKS